MGLQCNSFCPMFARVEQSTGDLVSFSEVEALGTDLAIGLGAESRKSWKVVGFNRPLNAYPFCRRDNGMTQMVVALGGTRG